MYRLILHLSVIPESYDVVICQAVLRHLDSPESFVKKMMEFAKTGAYIICIDSNREFECDGLYIDGMDYFRLCEHAGMEKHWRAELEQQGRDYAVAIRNAHMMRKLGLKELTGPWWLHNEHRTQTRLFATCSEKGRNFF